jgi:hypothetical protein
LLTAGFAHAAQHDGPTVRKMADHLKSPGGFTDYKGKPYEY